MKLFDNNWFNPVTTAPAIALITPKFTAMQTAMQFVNLSQSLELVMQVDIPTCSLTTTSLEALSLLQKGGTYAIALDRRGHPRGLLDAQCFLGWLTAHLPDQADGSASSPGISLGSSVGDLAPLVAWQNLTLADIDLQPLPAIAANTTLGEFIDRISGYYYSANIWALTDVRGKYLGVVEVLPLLRQLLRQNSSPQSPQILTNLLQLIEQLPQPLMIHNHKGEVLGMNQVWRDRLDGTLTQADRVIGQTKIYQCCTPDGVACTWQVESVQLNGEMLGLEIAIAQDITQQERLSTELSLQNADLVRLNRLKDEFLACISHELKTPLTSVLAMASLLNSQSIGELNDRQSRYVDLIRQSGRHLTLIVDNIVDLAKAETRQLELYPELLVIEQICQKSIQQMRKLLQQDSLYQMTSVQGVQESNHLEVEVVLDIDPAIKTLVADEMRVQQMLVNLLSNAFKFTENLLQPKVGLTVSQWEGWIAFTVWDRGIGIPDQKQHLIFQKFQQLENPLTRRFDGAGLGLVLTRHLARLHGGEITFVSQEGVGSQFTILLPPSPPDTVEIGAMQVAASSTRLVLVVEASTQDVDQLMTVLTAWGYRVVVARSGPEALEKARRLQPCLIVLSPVLPMLSGWDVLALLKQDFATQQIRVIMAVTSSERASEEFRERLNEREKDNHQVDGFLVKPIQTGDLTILLQPQTFVNEPLTLLCLGKELKPEITDFLQSFGHRLLEADGVGQGEMLARIWHPNLIVLNCPSEAVFGYLRRIKDCNLLPSLPILVIGKLGSRLRQEFAQLSLFEFELFEYKKDEASNAVALELHQTIKRAMGHLHVPTVLLFNPIGIDLPTQSMHQYLLLAGFHVQVLHSPDLVMQQLQTCYVDVLLVMLHDSGLLSPLEQEREREAIARLRQVAIYPPMIAIDGRSEASPLTRTTTGDSTERLIEMATVVLNQNHAITELLPALRQCLSLNPKNT